MTRTRRQRLPRAAIVLAATMAAGLPLPALASAATPAAFTTGFVEGGYSSPSSAARWYGRSAGLGARVVLMAVDWAGISPLKPPAGTATDPANPDYSWGTLDENVRAATAAGLTVAFTVAGADGGPAWADGPHRPRSAMPGTWKPNAAALGEFAIALARRYSGSFNPGTGVLPHVRYYQAWSEQNLPQHLTPQWVKVGRHWVAESPAIYRGLLNAFYAGIKSVNRSDVVITGGTAPFGNVPGQPDFANFPGGPRVPPAMFVRDLLCLNGRLAPQRCPDPAHFDVLAHHPFSIGGPYVKAANPDDVSVPDMAKLTRPLAIAERTGRALPPGHKRVWVTEFFWNTKPPNPGGIPVLQRATWIPEAFYELWHEGVDTLCWYQIEDEPGNPSYSVTFQAGMYYVNGRPKPGDEAFRFPFLVVGAGGGRGRLWGITPDSGTVLVQRRSAGHWVTVARFRRAAHAIFTGTVADAGRPLMRALVGHEASMAWRAP